MNFNKFINSDYLKSNPLCGISTYKDELNLATGACTRQIKKLKLLSSLGWKRVSNGSFYTSDITDYLFEQKNIVKCSHFTSQLNVTGTSSVIDNNVAFYYNLSQQQVREFYVAYRSITSLDEFKAFLDNNDVYIWYVLATPTTETITVPSGLSGTEEGYLIQDGTPTPTNPIYPTANEVKVWHDIPHYIHNTSTDTITTLPADIYANDTTATVGLKGQMEQNGTPTPTTPIQPSECGDLETEGAKAGQYKIPISSASTTSPVYLGEVETTRKIKKLVFDGTENWRQSVNGAMYLSPFTGESYKKEVAITSMNSHFAVQINTTSGTNQVGDNSSCFFAASGSAEYYIGARSYATATDFKAYLAQQYAAGTPVCVWYVLATETTGIVNEPLRKIGDYADEVSGITIPTIAGANAIDVDTTLKPSEVTVNYKGWHPVSGVHERENGQWD